MCAHREPSKIPRWEVISDLQSSSQSSRRSPSDSQSVDIVAIGSSSKRKAAFPSMGSQRHQKIARTDTSHYPGRSIKETEATSRTRDTFESRSTTTSPISTKRKRRKVILPQNREALQRLIAPLTVDSRQNGHLFRPRNTGLGSEATRIRPQKNPVEIIELLSDSDTPPPGDASNPIVLDSGDEADEPGSLVYPLLEVSRSTPRRENIHPDPPSGSNHLARSHTPQSSSPPDTSNIGDEFHDAAPPSVQRASLSPQSEHSIRAVDQPSVVNGKPDQTSLPIQDNSEIQDKMPNGVSENTREASSPVASSSSPMSPESRNKEVSDRLAISRISSSPNQSHLPPGDAFADRLLFQFAELCIVDDRDCGKASSELQQLDKVLLQDPLATSK
ncbi:hypothetical protein BGY98DRAFT_685229 [Russula aff. rugulosa BPL654]|nr:hypothetical protein BGY98DRAFT_685229 [Russula aff. rugulosa BPL654]